LVILGPAIRLHLSGSNHSDNPFQPEQIKGAKSEKKKEKKVAGGTWEPNKCPSFFWVNCKAFNEMKIFVLSWGSLCILQFLAVEIFSKTF